MTVVTGAGHTTTTVYNNLGQVVSTSQSGSHVTTGEETFKYNSIGQVAVSTDATGKSQYFLYDDLGRLVAQLWHNGQIQEFFYDDMNRVVGTVRSGRRISSTHLTALDNPNHGLTMDDIRPS
ncbi:hypothetical protein RMQ97_15410, partial [Maricaulis sp. D1M11]